jgi:hypothetical protein
LVGQGRWWLHRVLCATPLATLAADNPAPRFWRGAGDLRSAIDEEGIVSVISVPQAFNEDELYVDLRSIFGRFPVPEV